MTLVAADFDARALGTDLERVFAHDPRLRPRPDMHDYQLTYPPAVAIEQLEHRCEHTPQTFVSHGIGAHRDVALYFHFGFCAYRCRYCFHYEIQTKHDESLQARYVDALLQETRVMRGHTAHMRPVFFFLGGGTPTAIDVRLIDRFLDGLVDAFGAPKTALSTVEAKPVTATREKLSLYVQAGFRRINLGVQTLDRDLYAYHHHGEDLSVAYAAIERARAVGFEHINIDILTGLRKQTPQSWTRTLRGLEGLASNGWVDSVFIYPYHDDPRSPTFGNPDALPGFVETAQSEAEARALFERLGWWELGPRFFRSKRHVVHEAIDLVRLRANPFYGSFLYLGIGNSAFSVGDRAAWVNERNVQTYCERIEAGGIGLSHLVTLDPVQRATRDLTFDLLYSPHVRVRALARRYGEAAMEGHVQTLNRWTELGLGEWNRWLGSWRLTSIGKLLHQQMLLQLYLPADAEAFGRIMRARKALGKRYRGY